MTSSSLELGVEHLSRCVQPADMKVQDQFVGGRRGGGSAPPGLADLDRRRVADRACGSRTLPGSRNSLV